MKFLTPTKVLVICLMLFFSATITFSQSEKTEQKSSPTEKKETVQAIAEETPKLPPMKEGERLTFMQKDEAVMRSQPESGSLLMKTVGAMFLIVGLVFFGGWALKKLGFSGINSSDSTDAPELTILSSVSPKNGQTISVVKFGERTLLVGSTAQSFTLLAEEEMNGEQNFESNNFENKPRSVAEMLAEEEMTFGEELQKAESKLDIFGNEGGQV